VRRLFISFMLALVVSGPPAAHAQAMMKIIEPIDSLRNMHEISVVVEDIPVLEKVLNVQTLKTAIERRLRQAGIEVPADDKADPIAAFVPYLYANVNVIKAEPGGYVYSLSLQFKRAVEVNNVDRNRNFLFATTWDKGGLGLIPVNEYRSIQQSLDEYVTAFLADYLAVNPKP
jgi:hypothetical protein